MIKIEESFEIPQCPICHETYDDALQYPIVLPCGHGLCKVCFDKIMQNAETAKCPTCRDDIDEEADIPKNYQLLETLSTFNTMRAEQEKVQVKCVECARIENEQMMYSCLECADKNQKCKIVKGEELQSMGDEPPRFINDLKKIAICANCSILNHIKKNHDVVEFYSLLSTRQADKYVEKVELSKNKIIETSAEWDQVYHSSMLLIDESLKELDNMTELIQRGKSSAAQQKIVTRTQSDYEKFGKFVTRMAVKLLEINENLGGELEKMAEENDRQISMNCYETAPCMYAIDLAPPEEEAPEEKIDEEAEIPQEAHENTVDNTNGDAETSGEELPQVEVKTEEADGNESGNQHQENEDDGESSDAADSSDSSDE